MKATATYTFQFIVTKIIGDFLYFPIWWYSEGLLKTAKWWLKKNKQTNKRLGLTIWLKHLFVPMYGEYNLWGRIISFFVRMVVLIFRLIIFIILFTFFSIIFIFYFISLPGVTLMFFLSLSR